ncbi:hypothetical protein CC1G_01481 [Coprinopsis cinerea okayama7|uniref:F-box domain-containing protein n=1 Tax=Coprinopsis cinerea (strain Okayama-7 / 130 / ATCC MYA-4618 / FGSC 9003) TaxID=240176 RepID=A8NHQ6_COPC7|nr:hypothetical protein CC1G_01481 [Coprinopsis cinerea okayama7\|eukprot:XP_001833804.2 hypothetical protein CC1G_01481 [Coprinopsis cinerea okayama7\
METIIQAVFAALDPLFDRPTHTPPTSNIESVKSYQAALADFRLVCRSWDALITSSLGWRYIIIQLDRHSFSFDKLAHYVQTTASRTDQGPLDVFVLRRKIPITYDLSERRKMIHVTRILLPYHDRIRTLFIEPNQSSSVPPYLPSYLNSELRNLSTLVLAYHADDSSTGSLSDVCDSDVVWPFSTTDTIVFTRSLDVAAATNTLTTFSIGGRQLMSFLDSPRIDTLHGLSSLQVAGLTKLSPVTEGYTKDKVSLWITLLSNVETLNKLFFDDVDIPAMPDCSRGFRSRPTLTIVGANARTMNFLFTAIYICDLPRIDLFRCAFNAPVCFPTSQTLRLYDIRDFPDLVKSIATFRGPSLHFGKCCDITNRHVQDITRGDEPRPSNITFEDCPSVTTPRGVVNLAHC